MNQDDWSPIARLTNLADAGFFEQVLDEADVPVRIDMRDDFNALAGHWQPIYVIQVPKESASQAIELVQGRLQEDSDSIDVDQAIGGEAPAASESGGWPLWRPFALMLVAAGLVYFAVRAQLPRAGRAAPRERDPVWDVLAESAEELSSKHRVVRYDPDDDVLIVIDDLDGDGHMDLRREYSDGELVRELQLEDPRAAGFQAD